MHLEKIVPCLRELVSVAAVSWDTEPAATQLGNTCSVRLCVWVCARVCEFMACCTCFAVCSCLFLGVDNDDGGGIY